LTNRILHVTLHNCRILPVGNNRGLLAVLYQTIAVINSCVQYICVPQHSLWNRCVQSETCTSSSVFDRLFLHFKVTLRLWVHKWKIPRFVPIVLWCLSLSGDRNGQPCRHDTAISTDTADADTSSPT